VPKWTQKLMWMAWVKKCVLLLLEIDTQFFGCPTHRLVTMRILKEKNPNLQR